MDYFDLENKINELETKVNNLQELNRAQSAELESLKSNPITRLIDEQSKNRLSEILRDQIVDITWDRYFRYTSTFESISRYIVMGTTNSGDVTSDGMEVSTASGTDYVRLYSSVANSFNTSRRTRFQCVARVDATTDINASIVTLQNTGEIGFNFDDGTLKAYSTDGSGSTLIELQSYSADTDYKLEFKYEPGGLCIFYVDDVEKGSISTKLPPLTDDDVNLYTQTITVSGGTSRKITCRYFDIMQDKENYG